MKKTENPLRKYLDEERMTLEKFSEISGIATSTVYRISENLSKPHRFTAQRIFEITKGRVDFEMWHAKNK